MIQKYGGASAATVEPFLAELKAMIDGRGNHPAIIQWDVFNEGDCVDAFNVSEVITWIKAYDPWRLIDTNSGGPANNLHIGDVNDDHTYPFPGNPSASATQYAMVGEFGCVAGPHCARTPLALPLLTARRASLTAYPTRRGIGAFIQGKEWSPTQCFAYLANPDPESEAEMYVNMTRILLANKAQGVSASIFTQLRLVVREAPVPHISLPSSFPPLSNAPSLTSFLALFRYIQRCGKRV